MASTLNTSFFKPALPRTHIGAWVNGAADTGVMWSMNPNIGTLSSDGIYTPPTHVTARQDLLLIAKAHADPRVLTTVRVTLLPEGPIRIDNGNPSSYNRFERERLAIKLLHALGCDL